MEQSSGAGTFRLLPFLKNAPKPMGQCTMQYARARVNRGVQLERPYTGLNMGEVSGGRPLVCSWQWTCLMCGRYVESTFA
jgi:hypothetical protein